MNPKTTMGPDRRGNKSVIMNVYPHRTTKQCVVKCPTGKAGLLGMALLGAAASPAVASPAVASSETGEISVDAIARANTHHEHDKDHATHSSRHLQVGFFFDRSS